MAGKGIIRIYYKDSSYKSFYLHEDVSAREVADLFAEDFLHVEKRVVAHFSIHVIIDGKDIRQLKPEDRPLRVQRDLFSLKISWNTDKNYFLFCLSDEAKVRMTQRLGSTTNMQGTSTPNADNANARPLSRKMSFMRPKLTLFNTKRKSSEANERPTMPTRSESEVFESKRPSTNTTATERRSTISGENPNTASRQEISENLKKMVLEEKKKLEQGDRSPKSSTRPGSITVGDRTKAAPEQARVTSGDKQTPDGSKKNTETSAPKKPTEASVPSKPAETSAPKKPAETSAPKKPAEASSPKKPAEASAKTAVLSPPRLERGDTSKKMEETKRQTVAGQKNDPRLSSVVAAPSPGTVRRENQEIANMFDSIFDWCPPTDPPSAAVNHSPSASVDAPKASVDADEEFNETFDDILNVLHKLGTA